MSIVRSLLIKVGFVTDKQSANQTDRSITRFKSRFVLLAGAATFALTKIARYFSDVATATLDADLLARSLGLSLVEFTKLQKASESFRINDKQFTALFQSLDKNITNFRYKLDGELLKLAQAFDFDPTKVKNSAEAFEKIIEKLNTITNDQQRKDFAEVFFPGLGQQLADLSKNIDDFNNKKDSYQEFATQLQQSLPILADYEKAVKGFSDVWQKFVVSIGSKIIPSLTNLVNAINPVLDILGQVINFYDKLFSFDFEGVKVVSRDISKSLDPVFEGVKSNQQASARFFGGILGENLLPYYNKFVEYAENRQLPMSSGVSMGGTVITNNIDIQVPPGTTEQQAEFISNTIEQKMNQSINNNWRDIQNNNPMVE